MSSPNKRFQLRLATLADEALVNQVFDSGDFSGKISVQFTRHPRPLASLNCEADRTVLALVIDTQTGAPCGTGCCQVRRSYMDGQCVKVGYLSSMRVVPEYQGKLGNIAEVYQFLFDHTPEVSYYYTTILKENQSAIAMLEKPRRHFPRYYRQGGYTVYCLSPKLNVKKQPGFLVEPCSHGHLMDFLAWHQQNTNLATVDLLTKESRWYCLRNRSGQLLGCGALTDQTGQKQYVVSGYGGMFRLLPYLPTAALGYPRVPKVGQPALYASIGSLFVLPEAAGQLSFLVSEIAGQNQEYDFIMAGVFEESPHAPVFERLRHIKYQSYLYQVGKEDNIDRSKIQLDVALL